MKTSPFHVVLFFGLLLGILSAKNGYSQKDRVITIKGDTIQCSIKEIDNEKIFFEVGFKTHKVKTYHFLADIQSYEFYYINTLQEENDTISVYKISLYDGALLIGKVISVGKHDFEFKDFNIGKITIQASKISHIEREDINAYYLIQLIDGSEYNGKIINHGQHEMKFNTKDLGLIQIPVIKIKSIKLIEEEDIRNGKYWFPNPNSTRYLFAPSAIGLQKGEGYYQNAYAMANSVNVGLSDHVSIGGGVLIPFIFYITPKFSFNLTEKIYAGGGLLYAFLPGDNTNIGIAYGVATYGSHENNFTLGAGYGFIGTELAKRPIITVNAMTRLSRKTAFVTENWIVPVASTEYLVNVSYGIRLMNERFTWDFAFVNNKEIIQNLPLGIPYVDFVFKF